MVTFLDFRYGWDGGHVAFLGLLDLSVALDTINHGILVRVRGLGISGTVFC